MTRFLLAVRTRPLALVIEGDPGIGKTTLISAATEAALGAGLRILAARPTSSESKLSFAGLTDMLSDATALLAALPAPQRKALEIALLLRDSPDDAPDRRAIGMGLLNLLRLAARAQPVLLVVDDLQWLDRPSIEAIAFAVRRLTTEPIGVLVAARSDMAQRQAGEWLARLPTEHITVQPLSVGALRVMLADQLELTLPRTVLLRVHELSRGNPLLGGEVGRALREHGVPEAGQPLDLPVDVDELIGERVRRLPADTLDALAICAGMAAPGLAQVARARVAAVAGARGSGDDLIRVLEPALAADIIRLERDRVRFTHPLLASAVHALLDATARRNLHRRIATAVTDLEERARHLALAAEGPDRAVAEALDNASARAAARGAPAPAAELAELAVTLTPANDERSIRRRLDAAARHFESGDVGRAREIAQALIDELPAGIDRARALHLLADGWSGDHARMKPLREQAVAEAAGSPRVLAAALRMLALTEFTGGSPVAGLAHAQQAVTAAEQTGDPRLVVPSLAHLAFIELWNGRITEGVLERALALEPQAGYLRIYESPATINGVRLMMLEDDLDAARTALTNVVRSSSDHGDDEARAVVLAHLTEVECRAGRLDVASQHATAAHEIRQEYGLGTGATLHWLAYVQALRGDVQVARAGAREALADCERVGYEVYAVRNLRLLGFIALSEGDAITAASLLAPLPDRLSTRGYGRVNLLQVLPDAVEALIAVRDLDQADILLAQLDDIVTDLRTAYAGMRAARAHGLLAAARRDYARANAAFGRALAEHERVPDPLEHGRTLLALGHTQRRAGQRREARASLLQAHAIFDELGARLWAAQARAEVARIGGRSPAVDSLTGAEEHVAQLVAAGRTNKEVAASLFITERTVETHLTSIFRKLELRSRTELAYWLAQQRARRVQ